MTMLERLQLAQAELNRRGVRAKYSIYASHRPPCASFAGRPCDCACVLALNRPGHGSYVVKGDGSLQKIEKGVTL